METVIPPNKKSGHVIQKYNFKVLSVGAAEEQKCSDQEQSLPEETELKRDEEPSVVDESKDDAMEQMLKKADELSTNLVKMQMQLEKQQEEFEKVLAEAKESAFEEGRAAGEKSCKEQMQKRVEELEERFTHSILALEKSRETFLQKVDTIEEELIETALDLAKQVIVKEVQSDSKEVAFRLAKLLLSEVKDAAEVTLKVNPKDYEYLKEKLGKDSIVIEPDAAVGAGGVIIQSDIGNIDGEIMNRFDRVKEAVFGTVSQGER